MDRNQVISAQLNWFLLAKTQKATYSTNVYINFKSWTNEVNKPKLAET